MLLHKRNFAVRHCASKDETRLNLCGVHVTADGRTVATNGHLMAVVDAVEVSPEEYPLLDGVDPGAAVGPVTIPLPAIESVVKALPKRTYMPILEHAVLAPNGGAETVVLASTDLETPQRVSAKRIEGFPLWEQVVPSSPERIAVTLGIPVLEALLKTAKEFAKDAKYIRFGLRGEFEAFTATLTGYPGITFTGMPVRDPSTTHAQRAWASSYSPDAAA